MRGRIMRCCVIAAAFGLSGTASAGVLPSPVLQYTFDEGGAGPVQDTGTGDPAPGLLMGPAAYSTSTLTGTGYSLDLRDAGTAADYAHVVTEGDVPKLEGLSAFTASTWVNLDSYAGGNRRLMSKQDAAAQGFSFGVASPTGDNNVASVDNLQLTMFINGAAAGTFGRTGNVDLGTAGEWAFVAATYDSAGGADNLKFYVGDAAADSELREVGTFTVTSGALADTAARFGLGFTDAAPASNQSLLGLQDDVRIYDVALSSEDLNAVRLSNVPEPASLALVSLGGLALLARRRRGL